MSDFAERRAAFRQLHQSGCFVLPNPWDAGGAARLQKLGFKALASSSAAAAWALGKDDGALSLNEALEHLRMLCAATELPVNADFESGFGDTPEQVGASLQLAVETGVAGLSVEDRLGRKDLYGVGEAARRVAAARRGIERTGQDVVLVARAEGFLVGRKDLGEAIARLKAFIEVGADCVYAPGVAELGQIAELVQAVAPVPVNVLLSTTKASVAELASVGVRRVSVGGRLAAAAWAAFDAAAEQLLNDGRIGAA